MSNAFLPQDDALPHLSKYRIVGRLGQGGMGSVYLGTRHRDTELRVIKIINDDLLDNETVAHRFLREANVTSQLIHDHIARVTDAGREDDGRHYIVMELIEGEELEVLMRLLHEQGKMVPPGLTLTIAQDVLRALHYAHTLELDGQPLSIVHRDMSPRNVMVDLHGHGKIIDFGLVRSSLGDWKTRPGMLLGTLRYLSPEQAVTSPVNHRSDIYSFAVVLWETLTGQFWVPEDEVRNMLGHIVSNDPPPLSEMNPALPDALTPVLQRALRKVESDRFEDAESFRQALFAAAPDLSATPRAQIASFMQGCFPQKQTQAAEFRALVTGADATHVHEGPPTEKTRAGIALTEDDAPEIELTRTGFIDSHSFTPAEASPEPKTTEAPSPAHTNPRPAETSKRVARPPLVAFATIGAVLITLLTVVLTSPRQSERVVEIIQEKRTTPTAVAPTPRPRTPAVALTPRPRKAPAPKVTSARTPTSIRRSSNTARAKVPSPSPRRPPKRPKVKPANPATPPRPWAKARAHLESGEYKMARAAIRGAAQRLGAKSRERLFSCMELAEYESEIKPKYENCLDRLLVRSKP